MNSISFENSSFRDNSGFVFYADNEIFRAITVSYKEEYDSFMQSGLYEILTEKGYLIPFEEIEEKKHFENNNIYKLIKPTKVPFISYPYEWSFSQLKDAAILTLNILKICLEKGFILKDASAYNIQFINNKPIFIDSLSFEKYKENEPWNAYKQFCEHFVNPLLLSYYSKFQFQKNMISYPEGIPLELTSKLLPYRTRFKFFSLMHVHWHAKAEIKNADKKDFSVSNVQLKKDRLMNLITHLKEGLVQLSQHKSTNWTGYYQSCNYDSNSITEKKELIEKWLKRIQPETLFDAGCNEGVFSTLGSYYSKLVIAADNDPSVIDYIYKLKPSSNILPLVIDLTNPTPAIGWNNIERKNFSERINRNSTTLALALIHHLAIGRNIPFEKIAAFFSEFSENLIIEFVPKTDPQVKRLLVSKKDIFSDYTIDEFLATFKKYFEIIETQSLTNIDRILFFLKRKNEMV